MDGTLDPKTGPLLSCKGVSVDYVTAAGNARACNQMTLDIHPGETVGLAGESGCGKSTLAFAITRMHNAPALISEGEILFEGRDILKMDDEALRQFRWSETAMVFQSAMNALNPVITIGAQLTDVILAKPMREVRNCWKLSALASPAWHPIPTSCRAACGSAW